MKGSMVTRFAQPALENHVARTAAGALLSSRALLWARYQAAHEVIRLPLIGLHRLTFAIARQRALRNRPLERSVRRRYRELLARDFDNAQQGLYSNQLLFDFPLRAYLESVPRFLLDVPSVLARLRASDHRDLPRGVDLGDYPAYYRRNFHWQTDGYFSRHSAMLYDLGVEFLFVGCADVMRRQALAEVLRQRPARTVRLLDVGAGTGRFLAQAAASLPGSTLVGVELSPWYARFAEEQWARNQSTRAPRMVVANAEALPFPDRSFDVVTSIFLLHELPRRVRRTVLEEMRRVLVPGGLLVLEDAAQPTDSPELAPALGQFSKDMHEPFFRDYLEDDLAELLGALGLSVRSVAPHFVSKVVCATAPLQI